MNAKQFISLYAGLRPFSWRGSHYKFTSKGVEMAYRIAIDKNMTYVCELSEVLGFINYLRVHAAGSFEVMFVEVDINDYC